MSEVAQSPYKNDEEYAQHQSELSEHVDIEGQVMRYVTFRDHSVAPFRGVVQRLDHSINHWKPREQDIWICGYAKSGTHWINEIVHMLLHNTLEPSKPKENFMLERVNLDQLECLQDPRVLNTHLPFNLLPPGILEANGKIIFVYRDVRDVLCSLYHHVSSRAPLYLTRYDTSWNAFLQSYYTGKLMNGNWFEYMLPWHQFLEKFNSTFVLPIKYEDVKCNPIKEITKICQFLRPNYPKPSDSLVCDIAEQTQFNNMKQIHSGNLYNKINIYRKGIVGDWKNMFSESQLLELKQKQFDVLPKEYQTVFVKYSGISEWLTDG